MRLSYILAVSILFFTIPYSTTCETVKIQVVATINPLSLIAKDVGGSRVKVYTLVPAGVDPHTYAPSPSDQLIAQRSDIFLSVGKEEFLGYFKGCGYLRFGWENWSRILYIKDGNPHYVWLYPPNVAKIAKSLAEAFKTLDPEGSLYYDERLGKVISELQTLPRWIEKLKAIYGVDSVKVVLAGSHLQPMIEYLNISIIDVVVKGDKTPTPQDVVRTVNLVRRQQATAIVVHALEADLEEGRLAYELSSETGVPILVFYPLPLGSERSYSEFFKIISSTLISSIANLEKARFNARTTSQYTDFLLPILLAVFLISLFKLLSKR